MTRSLRVAIVAAMATLLPLFSAQPVLAQVRLPDVGGPVREYEAQPAPAPTPRPPRDAVTGVGATQGGVRSPRFIVEALNFKAVDETGVDALGNDEILPFFSSGANRMAARVVSVGSNDVVQFSAGQSCIWPAVDDGAPYNHAWACAPQGGRAPVRFGIVLYEVDVDLSYELNVLFTGNFQICSGSDLHDELSCHEARTVVFQRDFAF